MTRTIGYVPVRVGRETVSIPVEIEPTAATRVDFEGRAARIVVSDELGEDARHDAVAAVLPEVQTYLARKLLN